MTLFPNRKIMAHLSVAYAFYVGIGLSLSIHWFSDFVTGAIIGTLLGIIVGRNFRAKLFVANDHH